MPIKIKISKPGFDVKKETDARNFIFNSDLNHLKTSLSGSYQQSIANSATHTQTIAHGLSYRPLVLSYFRNTANSNWFIASTDPEQSIGRLLIDANLSLFVDTTNVYLKLWNYTGGTAIFEVKYEIFYEGDV